MPKSVRMTWCVARMTMQAASAAVHPRSMPRRAPAEIGEGMRAPGRQAQVAGGSRRRYGQTRGASLVF